MDEMDEILFLIGMKKSNGIPNKCITFATSNTF